jgi:adenylate cyclase
MRARSWLATIFIPLFTAGACVLLAFTGVFSPLEGWANDIFLLLKRSPTPASEVLLVDLDDRASTLAGAWPWTRDTLADGLVTLKEMGAGSVILDLPLAQRSPPALDPFVLRQTLPDALDAEFSQMGTNIQSLFDAIRRGSVRPKDSARYVTDLIGLVAMAKGRLLDATMGIARDDDALLGQAVAFFGAAYVPVDLLTSSDPQTDEELLALALQRASFTPVLSGADPSPRQAGIRPSVLPVVRAARGGGFTSVRPDGDGVYRGATVTETFQDRHLGQIAFAALLDELGKPSVEIDPARIVLRGAVHHDVPLRAITIPLDGQGRVLLDWPRAGAEDGFRHLSWADLIRYRRLENELVTELRAMDSHGYMSYLRSATSLLDVFEEAARRERDMLASGDDSGAADWRAARDQFVTLTDQLLNGDAEARIVDDAGRALRAPGISPAEQQAISGERERVHGSFDDARRTLAELQKVRVLLQQSLPGAFCIVSLAPGRDSPTNGSTPFGAPVTEASAAAALVSTVLSGSFLREPPRSYGFIFAAALALALALVTHRFRPFATLATGFAFAAVTAAATAGVFLVARLILNPVLPIISTVLAGCALATLQLSRQRRATHLVRATFGGRVSSEGLKTLLSTPQSSEPGGARKDITVLSLAEKGLHASAASHDPGDVARQLAAYNAGVGEVIRSLQGMVGGPGGDRMIAYFGAPVPCPDHVTRACLAAVRIRRVETELNIVASPPLETRIGIDTGVCITGMLGAPGYSVVGSANDLAVRLEGLNEHFGTHIIVSETVFGMVHEQFLLRRLGRVRYSGEERPVRLFELMAERGDAEAALGDAVRLFEEGLARYESREYTAARERFRRTMSLLPGDGPSAFYLERCERSSSHGDSGVTSIPG